jgi:hypothetical protein
VGVVVSSRTLFQTDRQTHTHVRILVVDVVEVVSISVLCHIYRGCHQASSPHAYVCVGGLLEDRDDTASVGFAGCLLASSFSDQRR